jgi:hypothetical protein
MMHRSEEERWAGVGWPDPEEAQAWYKKHVLDPRVLEGRHAEAQVLRRAAAIINQHSSPRGAWGRFIVRVQVRLLQRIADSLEAGKLSKDG